MQNRQINENIALVGYSQSLVRFLFIIIIIKSWLELENDYGMTEMAIS